MKVVGPRAQLQDVDLLQPSSAYFDISIEFACFLLAMISEVCAKANSDGTNHNGGDKGTPVIWHTHGPFFPTLKGATSSRNAVH